MTQVPLAPPHPTKDPIFDRWVHLLWRRLTQAGQILWDVIDTTGSNLTDIETRNHNDLQNLDAGDYKHLTATNYTDLTDGGATTLHKHDHGGMDGLGDDDHTQYLLATGTRSLTADWDAGSFEIRAQTFESDVATGTAPLVITSTTKVSNLNVDLLDDQTGTYYLDRTNHTGTQTLATISDAGTIASQAANNVSITGGSISGAAVRLVGYTVATLPTVGTVGRIAYVTDALAPAYLTAVVGGGAVVTPVFDDGVAWVAM